MSTISTRKYLISCILIALPFAIVAQSPTTPCSQAKYDSTILEKDNERMYRILNAVNNGGLETLITLFTEAELTMDGTKLTNPLGSMDKKISESLDSINLRINTASYFYCKVNKELQDYRISLVRFQNETKALSNTVKRTPPVKMDVFGNNRFNSAYSHLILSRSLLMAAMDNRLFYEHNKRLSERNAQLSHSALKEMASIECAVMLLDEKVTKIDLHITQSEKRVKQNTRVWALIGGAVGGTIGWLLLK